jgi:hypothetical protein
MKKPEIKSWMTSDFLDNGALHGDINLWEPKDKDDFDFWMQLSIGLKGSKASDDFYVRVISQNRLSLVEQKDYLLVVAYFDNLKSIIELVEKSIASCTGSSWEEIAQCISKRYRWEFKDYH